MRSEASMPEWLELELAHHMAPVRAPEALAERVFRAMPGELRRDSAVEFAMEDPGRHEGLRHNGLGAYAAIAAMLVVMIAGGAWWLGAPRHQAVAAHESTAGKQVRLAGVRIVERNGQRFAEVAYTAGKSRSVVLMAIGGTPDCALCHASL
jgi:hypothetical protein